MAEDIVIAGAIIPETGTYRCTMCDYRLLVDGTESLQPCPQCGHGQWARATDEAAFPASEEAATDGRTR